MRQLMPTKSDSQTPSPYGLTQSPKAYTLNLSGQVPAVQQSEVSHAATHAHTGRGAAAAAQLTSIVAASA